MNRVTAVVLERISDMMNGTLEEWLDPKLYPNRYPGPHPDRLLWQWQDQRDPSKCVVCDRPITPEESKEYDNLCWACAKVPTQTDIERDPEKQKQERMMNSANMLTYRQRVKKGHTTGG